VRREIDEWMTIKRLMSIEIIINYIYNNSKEEIKNLDVLQIRILHFLFLL
jgi:hypothetical protein